MSTDKIVSGINTVAADASTTDAIASVVARGPYWLRNALYVASVIVGVVLTVYPIAQAFISGDAANALNSAYGVVVALAGLFAKLNITKPSID